MSQNKNTFLVVILGLMVAVGPFSIDMYLPAFQIIANEFGTTISEVALSMASYFVGMAAGQLLYGPLLDRYGRKKPLYVGLAVYLVASIACITASNINELIAYRFIQAVGGCAASVAAFAMVRDLFPVKDTAKVFSSLMLVISASPVVAPSVGGFASIAWGWQSVFIILIIVTILILILVFFSLPESHAGDPTFSLAPKDIVKSFSEVMRHPQFFTYAMAGGIAFSGLFVFVSTSPFLYMKLYGLSEKEYSILFAILVGGMIATSQSNRLLLRRVTSEQLVVWFIPAQLVLSAVLTVIGVAGWQSFYAETIPLFLYLTTVGIILPNSSALVLAPFSHNAGTASSLMGALQLGFGALASFIVSIASSTSSMPMAIAMLVCSVLACTVLLVGRTFVKTVVHGEVEAVSH